jgi:hypothetical protein
MQALRSGCRTEEEVHEHASLPKHALCVNFEQVVHIFLLATIGIKLEISYPSLSIEALQFSFRFRINNGSVKLKEMELCDTVLDSNGQQEFLLLS